MSVAEIQKTISDLSEKDRAKLAAWILESLPPSAEDDAGDEGIEEAARRRAELDSGQAQPLSEKEFWDSIAQERKQWT